MASLFCRQTARWLASAALTSCAPGPGPSLMEKRSAAAAAEGAPARLLGG